MKKRQWLIDIRKKRQLEQSEVAKLVGVTQQFYSYIESGSRRPSPEVAQEIARILNFDWTLFYSKPKKNKINTNPKEE